MVRYFYKWFSPAHYTHTVHICRVLPAAVCFSDYIHIHYICMSSIWVRLLLHSVHTAAFVMHLQLPTLTTASCVLPWTFISAHSVLPVWQEMEGQLTRQRRTPAALNAPLSTETCTCFYSSQLFIPSLLRVASWSKLKEASWFCSPRHAVSPHFITLLPLWAAVPTALGGAGGIWNVWRC